jgi:UDPglucose 6-dehydrogenase
MDNMRKKYGNKITFCDTNYEAIENSDALIILTEWDEFRIADFSKIKLLMK